MIWLAIFTAAVACIAFACGVVGGIALCIWASETRIHEPLE
jgi:hypothetical protein